MSTNMLVLDKWLFLNPTRHFPQMPLCFHVVIPQSFPGLAARCGHIDLFRQRGASPRTGNLFNCFIHSLVFVQQTLIRVVPGDTGAHQTDAPPLTAHTILKGRQTVRKQTWSSQGARDGLKAEPKLRKFCLVHDRGWCERKLEKKVGTGHLHIYYAP